ncbi:MAG: GDSL-type esterase/lipase family protein [Neisseria sp.]|nr:GDSL-type esterase/lipase family protein [Neisseria sp.]
MPFSRRQFLTLCAALSLAACSAAPRGTKLARGSRVLALGDSLTEGYGATRATAYPAVLAQLTGWDVINGGVSGDTSADVLKRLPALLTQQPQLVLLGIGGNDFLRRVAESETRANIRNTLQAIRAANIPAVLIAEPHLTAAALLTGSLSDHPLYAELAAENDVPLLADAWSDVLSDKKLKSDQIHANAEGYRVFAEKLEKFLKKEGFV